VLFTAVGFDHGARVACYIVTLGLTVLCGGGRRS
jgi:hypothetical protein